MGVFTAAGKNALLNEIDGLGWFAAPFNGDPSGGGTELSGSTTEGRIALTGKLAAAAAGSVANNAALLWTATASITIDHVAIYSAASEGVLLGRASVDSTARTSGQEVTFEPGDLDFSLTDPV